MKRARGRVAERFVLLPDADERGRVCSWRNRRRFYSLGLRANVLVPHLFVQVGRRLLRSLEDVLAGFLSRVRWSLASRTSAVS